MKLKIKLLIAVTVGMLLIGITVPMAISGINNQLDGEYNNFGTWTIDEDETVDIEGEFFIHVTNVESTYVDFNLNDPDTNATLMKVRDMGEGETVKQFVDGNVEKTVEINCDNINSTAGHVDLDISTIEKPLDHEEYVLDAYEFMPLMIVIAILVPIIYLAKDVMI